MVQLSTFLPWNAKHDNPAVQLSEQIKATRKCLYFTTFKEGDPIIKKKLEPFWDISYSTTYVGITLLKDFWIWTRDFWINQIFHFFLFYEIVSYFILDPISETLAPSLF